MQKIIVEGNVGWKWSEKKMEGEDALRTVECLRGRLLAERVASRNAKEETQQLENKLIELDALLKEETRSRNRAERRLKFLMKKLESLNILKKSEFTSSVSSTASSKTKQVEDKESNTQISTTQNASTISTSSRSQTEETLSCASNASWGESETPKCHSEESIEKANSSMEETSNSPGESHSELESNRDDHSLKASNEKEEVDGDNYKDRDHYVDNSMALVPVDLPKRERTFNPEVLDATVKEVLDSLQRAKEKLQISMEQRRMIKVG